MSTTLTISQELNEKKLASINNATVKEALNQYYGELQTIGKATWTAYKSFALAYANMGKEVVKGKDGKEVERFKTKGQFYDFVGVNDSTGSLMLRAVAFNEVCLVDDKRLEEYGFTAGKVDMLSRVGVDDFAKFLSYCKSCKYGTLEELAGISDKSLRDIIKAWTEAGKPSKAVPMKEAKTKTKDEETKTEETKTEETKTEETEETKTEETKTEETKTEETKTEETEETKTEETEEADKPIGKAIRREDILEMSLHYTGIDKDNILEFCKWLKAEMLKNVK